MIKEILFSCEGHINCKSKFYTSHDVLQEYMNFKFTTGINNLFGDIDSGAFGVSYLLSMYNIDVNKKLLSSPLIATVDGKPETLDVLSKKCCYLDDDFFPLFSSKRKTILQLIEKGIKKSKINQTAEKICNLFLLDSERIHRPIKYVGNERFRAMAAVGYSFGYQVFCFPWLSKKMFNYYTNNILWLLDILEKLKVVVIVPRGE